MRILVAGDVPGDRAAVQAAVREALRPYGLPRDTIVTVAFVDDPAMRELNRRHRRLDRTTDVLSFGQTIPTGTKGADAVAHLRREPDGTLELGDVVISADQARRQARLARRSFAGEVAFLAAHGALHLVGFEDESPAGYREMVRLGRAAVANVV